MKCRWHSFIDGRACGATAAAARIAHRFICTRHAAHGHVSLCLLSLPRVKLTLRKPSPLYIYYKFPIRVHLKPAYHHVHVPPDLRSPTYMQRRSAPPLTA